MVRTQIQLTKEQAERLKRVAAQRGESMAEVLRSLVDEHLMDEPSRTERLRRALEVPGRFRSGRSDISEKHDDYLAEDFAV